MIASIVGAALWSILVSCVFGAVLFAIVAAVVRAFTLEAAIRHTLWTLALCTTAILPLIALAAGVARPPAVHARMMTAAQPAADVFPARTERAGEGVVPAANAGEPRRWISPAQLQPHPDRTLALIIVGIWLAGAAIGFAGIVRGLVRVRALKRRSSPLDAQLAAELPWLTENRAAEREIYLRLSYEIETPVAVGFRRPTILIPTELATQGGLQAIEGLILHEHAHLRRRDDWTNLVQRTIERLFWFNPLVWLFGRRIALEREIAADDAVVAATGQPEAYAKSLWQLAREMRMPEHTIVAPGALYTRKQISVRIEALLERKPVRTGWRNAASLAVIGAALGCGVAAAAAAPNVVLRASDSDSRTATVSERPHPVADRRSSSSNAAARADRTTARTPSGAQISASDKHAATIVSRRIAFKRDADYAAGANSVDPHHSASRRHARLGPASPALAVVLDPRVAMPPGAPLPPEPLSNIHALVAQAEASLAAQSALVAQCGDCDYDGHGTSSLERRNMSGADLRGVDWRGRTIANTNLSGADLAGARLDGVHFINSNLSGANLDAASLRDAVITATNISGVSLENARISGLRIVGESLSGMDFHGLDARSIVASCEGCNMSGTDLHGADLHGLRLSGINFTGADLGNSNLSGATLAGVNFGGADLQGSDLRHALFTGCTFDGANVSNTIRTGARFFPSAPAFDDL